MIKDIVFIAKGIISNDCTDLLHIMT